MPLSPPRPLAIEHDVEPLDCGVPALDDWLKRRARPNQARGGSRTYVVCDDARVVAYYALAAGAIAAREASGRMRRNMPEPIPVVVLGRLAIDRTRQGQGLGRALMRDAVHRTMRAVESIAIRGLLVHAISEDAKTFYRRLGFESSPLDPLVLMITLNDIRAITDAALQGSGPTGS